MTKNEIKTLIQDIARDEAEDETIDLYYDEVVEELGKLTDPPLVEIDLLSLTASTATYSYPTDAIEPLHVFHVGNHLSRVEESSIEAYDKTWRDNEGTPKTWTTTQETSRTVRLFPIPDTTSTALDPLATEPFGEDFPANMGAIITSDSRETGIPDYIGLYIAFRVLYKEFIRPSDHQDIDWAMLHKEIANVFYYMGVVRHGERKTGKGKEKETPTAV